METNYNESLCIDLCKREVMEEDKFKKQLPGVVDDILKSLAEEDSPDHVGFPMIPSKDSILEVIALVETILYPGYFGVQEIDRENLPFYLGNQVNKLYRILTLQIAKTLMHECHQIEPLCTNCGEKAKEHTVEFLRKIPRLRKILARDIQATYDGDPAARSPEEIIFCYPGLKAITIYRVAHELWVQGIPILPRIMTEYAHGITGCDIHPGADIGEYFFIDHATGVVIGETTKIGRNVRIYQGVTLGALSFPKDERGKVIKGYKRHPTIEDGVIIYANATILGGDTIIGAGSIVGGNIWLTHSVPPRSRVLLNPEKMTHIELKAVKTMAATE